MIQELRKYQDDKNKNNIQQIVCETCLSENWHVYSHTENGFYIIICKFCGNDFEIEDFIFNHLKT